MKLTYQAPAYRHIALDGGTGASGCTIQAPHDSSSCAYTITLGGGSGLFGGIPAITYNIFSSTACSTSPQDIPSEYTGSGGSGVDIANVFGS